MAEPIAAKVRTAFASPSEREFAGDYLSEVRANWRETEKSATRTGGLLFALALIFELLMDGGVSETSFLFVKVADSPLVALALPTVMAYLFYQLTYCFLESTTFQHVHDLVLKEIHPAIYDASCEFPLHPPNSFVSSVDRLYYLLGADSREGRLAQLAGGIKPIALIIAPPGFLVSAYVRLFQQDGPISPLLWVSAGISLCLLAASFVNYVVLLRVD